MKHVVITGSSRGIGFNLAKAFLQRGCRVSISGRDPERLQRAYDQLMQQFSEESVFAKVADVSDFDQVQAFWDETIQRFQSIDIWINNAGITAPPDPLWEQKPEIVALVYHSNLIGLTYGCMVALNGMRKQGFGAIYNLEGAGSDGRIHPGLTLYGTTKFAIRYLTDSIAQEVKNTAIIVGALRPGMVLTDLVTSPYANRPEDWERFKPVLNLIAELPEVVAPRLVDKILQNKRNGVRLHASSRLQFVGRTLLRLVLRKRLV
ncbi:MAG: SDR family NAD(P)-dependent oxidoreductase [Anaerolineales bacterium]